MQTSKTHAKTACRNETLNFKFPIIIYFREKFLAGKKCHFHCSWKLVALALTLLTLILSSVIAYFGGKKLITLNLMKKVCCHILIQLTVSEKDWC
jgi:hypothetical protein